MKHLVSLLRSVILGSLVVSKASASVVTPQVSDDIWQNLRRHLDQRDTVQSDLKFDITDAITEPLDPAEVFEAVRFTYMQTRQEDWAALDEHWSTHPALQTNPKAFQQFLAARSSLQMQFEGTQEQLMQNWLHLAHHKPGHYDNGGGNGCGNGC